MTNTVINYEAEVALLGIILKDPSLIHSVDSLKPFMFSATAHQLIFATMQDVVAQGAVPEQNLLLATLSSKGKLNEAGGADYVASLQQGKHSIENIKEYEKQLKIAYKTKSLYQLSSGISGNLNKGQDIDALISDIKTSLDNLGDTNGGESIADMLTSTTDMWKELTRRLETPGLRGVTTGFSNLDSLTGGFNKGDLIVVAGRPGMGKTALMCNSAITTAEYMKKKETGEAVQIFSLEMNRVSLVERMVSIKSGVALADIRLGALSQEQLDKISATLKYLKELPIYIDTNFDANDVYYSAMVRKYHKLRNTRVTYFDYVQLASERGDDQTAEIGRFTRAAKILANDLGITNIVFSQLNRAVELREDKRPVLSDLRQSGNIEEDADIVMFLYRDDFYNPNSTMKGTIEYVIRKHRNGPAGSLWCDFNPEALKITPQK